MFCVKCGKELPEDCAFCPKCGEKIKQFSELDSDISKDNAESFKVNSNKAPIKKGISITIAKLKNRLIDIGKKINQCQMNYDNVIFKIFSILFIGWFCGEPFYSLFYQIFSGLNEVLSEFNYQASIYVCSIIIAVVAAIFAFIPFLKKFVKLLLKINAKFLTILWVVLTVWCMLRRGMGIGISQVFPIGWTTVNLSNNIAVMFNINVLFNIIELLLPVVSIWLLLKIKPKTPILPLIMVLAVSIPSGLFMSSLRYSLALGSVENYANIWMDILTVLFFISVFIVLAMFPKASKKINLITGAVILLLPFVFLQKKLTFLNTTTQLTSREIVNFFFSIFKEKAPVIIFVLLLSFCCRKIINTEARDNIKKIKIKSVILTSVIAICAFFAVSAGFSMYGSTLINSGMEKWQTDIENGINIAESGNWDSFEESLKYKSLFLTQFFIDDYEEYTEISNNYYKIKSLCEASSLYDKAVENHDYISDFSNAYKNLSFSEFDESSAFSVYNNMYESIKPSEDKIDIKIEECSGENDFKIECKNDNWAAIDKVAVTVKFTYLYMFYESYVDNQFESFTKTFILEDVETLADKTFKINPEEYYNGYWTCIAEMFVKYEITDISIF